MPTSPSPFRPGLLFIGFAEIIIGFGTLLGIAFFALTLDTVKPPNVLAFVLLSSLASTALGVGLLIRSSLCRKLLVFFSGWIILSKVLAFAGLLVLHNELETVFGSTLKNLISIAYHAFVIAYLRLPAVKKEMIR